MKGSRDPLGIQPIWTRLGRHVVGNLTTVTTSVRDFTTLLLGYYFAQRVAEDVGPGSELAAFLKWEQLAAYARAIGNGDRSFRGTERVGRFLDDGGSRVTLSIAREHQILSNQKAYGLWGLYSAAACSSGLLDGNPPRLTPPALEIIERDYLAIFDQEGMSEGRRVTALLSKPEPRIDARTTDPLIRAVARILRPNLRAREREFYRLHLLRGGPHDSTGGLQQQLATLIEGTLADRQFEWSPAAVVALANDARRRGAAWEPLASRLDRIRTAESVLAPMSALFTYLLGLGDRPIDGIVKRLREEWGNGLRSLAVKEVRSLLPELSWGIPGVGDRWLAIAEAAATGNYTDLLDLLIAQNGVVMEARGGARWLENRGGRLHVWFKDEQGALPQRSVVPALWRFPYFLPSLREIALAVYEER